MVGLVRWMHCEDSSWWLGGWQAWMAWKGQRVQACALLLQGC